MLIRCSTYIVFIKKKLCLVGQGKKQRSLSYCFIFSSYLLSKLSLFPQNNFIDYSVTDIDSSCLSFLFYIVQCATDGQGLSIIQIPYLSIALVYLCRALKCLALISDDNVKKKGLPCILTLIDTPFLNKCTCLETYPQLQNNNDTT